MSASVSNLPAPPTLPAPARTKRLPNWKDEVSARVRAHRAGRGHDPESQPTLPGMENAFTPSPGSIAARVAERYARIPSWREAMAAQAAAETAAAATAAAQAEPVAQAPAAPRRARTARVAAPPRPAPEPQPETIEEPLAYEASRAIPELPVVQPYQPDLIRYSVCSDSLPAPRFTPAEARAQAAAHALAQPLLTEFTDPLEEATVEPTRLLPARVIEFPRELIAPRKARPRIAEGPLFDDLPPSLASSAQADAALREPEAPEAEPLRIYEAEPEAALPLTQSGAAEQSMQEWHSIQLDNEVPVRAPKRGARPSPLADMSLHVAPVADRAMSAIVDVALTLAAFLVFVLVFAACTTHPPTGRTALTGAGVILFSMWVLYQFIFFSLSAATPGMRYARIALCTFDDENPTRKSMRSRIAALLLSALPLGLGFLWVLFDEDGLGWHDRITQTYQRSYRE
ncbi:MAG TPA: RDD family protein [Acidobacteriaceae bacterium]|nr:RDD family protein [Acidobacteriaceae bacterium]